MKRNELVDKFKNDLNKGEIGEKFIGNYFKSRGWSIKYNTNKDSDYDLMIKKGERIISLEIKTDEYYLKRKTNNMVFEVSYNNKPSGINSTKADYYIYYFPAEKLFYMASIKTIREIIMFCRTTMGGDKNLSKLYLVDRTEWAHKFKVIEVEKIDLNAF
jgi:hypothetical protein